MRAPGVRCAPGGAQEDGGGRIALTTSDISSAHLPDTPAGPLTIWVSPKGVRRLEFGPLPKDAHADPPEVWPEVLAASVAQLCDYFQRKRRSFDLPLDLESVTDFQREVYAHLERIPYGRVITYGELAEEVGRVELARAVGQAVGANPLPILIPCHRVVAAEGRLGGFTGGLAVKAALLRTENVDVEGELESSRIRPEVLRLEL